MCVTDKGRPGRSRREHVYLVDHRDHQLSHLYLWAHKSQLYTYVQKYILYLEFLKCLYTIIIYLKTFEFERYLEYPVMVSNAYLIINHFAKR